MKSKIFQFIKQFTPPIIWGFVRRLVVPAPTRHTYTGMFSSFSEVSASFSDATNYHSGESELVEVEGATCKLLKYESSQVPEEGPTLQRLNFLPTVLSTLRRNSLNILDVGGGLGTTFIDLKFCLPNKAILMTVVELPSVVENGRKIFRRYPDIKFVSAFPKDRSGFDVIYFGSSLQYFENYTLILNDSAHLGPEFIVIADTTMGPAPSFVCAQINMQDRAIPRMAFNKSELIELLDKCNYRLVHQSINYAPANSFDNYELPASLTAHWNLVFQRDFC